MSYPTAIQQEWIPLLKHLLDDERLGKIKTQVLSKELVAPDLPDIFRCFSFDTNVQCVLVGLSPYHTVINNKRTATGIPFAIPTDRYLEGHDYEYELIHMTPSLDRLIEGIVNDTGNIAVEETFDYSLESWCNQGVFMINRAMTVNLSTKEPRGHLKYWTWFVRGVLEVIDKNYTDVPFAFLGNDAWELSSVVTNNRKKKFTHPAAYSYALQRVGYNYTKVPAHSDIAQQGLFKWLDKNINWDNNEIKRC